MFEDFFQTDTKIISDRDRSVLINDSEVLKADSQIKMSGIYEHNLENKLIKPKKKAFAYM